MIEDARRSEIERLTAERDAILRAVFRVAAAARVQARGHRRRVFWDLIRKGGGPPTLISAMKRLHERRCELCSSVAALDALGSAPEPRSAVPDHLQRARCGCLVLDRTWWAIPPSCAEHRWMVDDRNRAENDARLVAALCPICGSLMVHGHGHGTASPRVDHGHPE